MGILEGCFGGQVDLIWREQLFFQLVRRVESDQPALGDDQDFVADGLHFGKDMGTEDDRMILPQLTDEIADLDDLQRIQAYGGFIQNDDPWVSEQGLGNTNTLAIAFGKGGNTASADFGDFCLLYHCFDLVCQRRSAQAFGFSHEAQVFERCFIHIKGWLFRQVANQFLGFFRLFENIITFDFDMSSGGGEATGHDIHGGRFSGAIWP